MFQEAQSCGPVSACYLGTELSAIKILSSRVLLLDEIPVSRSWTFLVQ